MLRQRLHRPAPRNHRRRQNLRRTFRGLLLTSYGFSEFGAKAAQAALVAYLAAALMGLLSIAGLIHGFVTPRTKGFAVPDLE